MGNEERRKGMGEVNGMGEKDEKTRKARTGYYSCELDAYLQCVKTALPIPSVHNLHKLTCY